MNRLVREGYPVSKLPEDLREGFEGRSGVTVTIEADYATQHTSGHTETSSHALVAEESWVERGKLVRQSNFTSIEDVDAYVQSLRE